ncbi:MAG TPA: DNA replication and repair protein RecF [Candidatus Dojkabacteria bacterium]|jgi:DNA replication and repair protein RecF|nr:DNA replication and repair protein RecF [Candidatus Dojkabacteria bacterium]
MITNIKLTNFRKFKNLDLNIQSKLIVLHGNNAKGKSTVLEAIYLLTNGKSPWAISDEFINTDQNMSEKFTRIEMTNNDKVYSLYKNAGTRVLKIDDQKVSPRKFFDQNASTIFNPEQIEILMISASARRKFLDEIISTVDYEYIETLTLFRKVLRQRNAYLKKLAKKFYDYGIVAINDVQLNFWTAEFLRLSEIIQTERVRIIDEMYSDDIHIEYTKSNGDTSLADAIENSKRRDIATGYTNIGPHRDDWQLINGKNIRQFGSRGEKRISIGKLVFKTQDVIKNRLDYYPILLLDDIASELDEENTKSIFNKKELDKQQTFITIIDKKDLPKAIIKDAQFIDLNNLG